MKYLKKFENIDQYYTNIDHKQYYSGNYYSGNIANFSDNEKEELTRLIESKKIYELCIMDYAINITRISKNGKIFQILIEKYVDEWFLCRFDKGYDTLFYKCDQFDGLIKLLENYI